MGVYPGPRKFNLNQTNYEQLPLDGLCRLPCYVCVITLIEILLIIVSISIGVRCITDTGTRSCQSFRILLEALAFRLTAQAQSKSEKYPVSLQEIKN